MTPCLVPAGTRQDRKHRRRGRCRFAIHGAGAVTYRFATTFWLRLIHRPFCLLTQQTVSVMWVGSGTSRAMMVAGLNGLGVAADRLNAFGRGAPLITVAVAAPVITVTAFVLRSAMMSSVRVMEPAPVCKCAPI